MPEKEEKEGEGNQQLPILPEKVVFSPRNGETMEVTRDKAENLMRMGLGFSQKMEEFKRTQKEQADALALGQDLINLRDTKPEVAQRILAIANGQEDPGQPAPKPAIVGGSIDEEALTESERALRQENLDLKSQLGDLSSRFESLSQKVDARENSDAAQRMERTILAEAKKVASWDADDAQEAVPEIARYMQESGGSLEEAVGVIAKRTEDRFKRHAQRLAKREAANRLFGLEPGSNGTPTLSSLPKGPDKRADLRTGKVLEAAVDRARGLFPSLGKR